ncbi:response regulator [Candidatus Nitrospira allomarina]|uniref:Response regulator n=1 Tax=Candidatus Nitrospira allomarina TaxID=3020900 RepID=A0AA96G7D6_9BACT|nr:response regulator [Candidatus Nitrospira allomarina]WNM56498.1 response regulator [Candidatus Nitrospira allomarina]
MVKHSVPGVILIAEDNIDDCVIACRAWEESGIKCDIRLVHNGREVLDFLYRRRKFRNLQITQNPDLIILDLNMPRMDGRQVLLELRADHRLCSIPVVVFSDSKMPKDMAESETIGALEYISKPESFSEYVEILKHLGQFILKNPGRLVYAGC